MLASTPSTRTGSSGLIVHVILALAISWIAACARSSERAPASATPVVAAAATVTPAVAVTATPAPEAGNLTAEQVATLASLTRVDDYPLYTMHYYGSYATADAASVADLPESTATSRASWACSLFAALGDAQNRFFGRNFDWPFSPALLLFTDPDDGYASVSMVDIVYLRFSDRSVDLTQLPLDQRRMLLEAPSLPFDGMNEAGVAVGMAAVPTADRRHDPGKASLGSIAVMREILDHAGSVDEAVAILQHYNLDWEGGMPLHYLVADRSGSAALVELYGGEIAVIPNSGPWHAATNFTRSAITGDAAGQCPRYDTLVLQLTQSNGQSTAAEALSLLRTVVMPSTLANPDPDIATQWSAVYNMSTGQIYVVMGRQYDRLHTFELLARSK